MTRVFSKAKQRMRYGIILLCIIFTVLLIPQRGVIAQVDTHMAQVNAETQEMLCSYGGPVPSFCPPRGLAKALNTIGEKIISPAFRVALIQSLLNLSQFVLNRLAYEAAVAIASGGPGEDSLFYNQTPTEAFGQLGLEVAGEAIGSLSELSSSKLGIEFNLCQPSEVLQLALKLGLQQKYQPTAPKCDFMEVLGNWDKFGAGIYQKYLDPEGRQEAILKAFASALKPGQNELTATLRFNIAIDQKIHEQKLLQFLERNKSTYQPVRDFITGTIKTPSETLQADFENALKKSKETGEQIRVGELANAGELIGGLALSTASTFTNVLLSQMLDRIYTGLFDTEVINIDPFDAEALGGGDKGTAQERFASIITTNPIKRSEYDALSDFVVCTAEGIINRGLYNCVMDVNFMAAVNRGTAGVPLTVQEAIDEGLLDGDWPLISPENEAANQDSFCYTYGYCYGNLVKLRKARVIPIGWELAAQRNSESNPATLQEVIDGFYNCTEEGTIGPAGASDSETKWCHLIDPNWVLKYPETQCRAVGNGEIRISTLSNGRNSTCVDSPSCIGEDNDGNCVDGYGYCTQEKNVWRFRGDECPEEYATCLSFTNADTGDNGDFLVSTVDYSVCDEDNAGCRWYRTNKYVEDAGTDDTEDDSYEWLATGDDYVLEERDVDMNYSGSTGRTEYSYTSDSGETYTYEQYTYEDRLYLTNDATECGEDDVGCTQLYEFDDTVYLNSVQNPSFEDDEDGDGTPDGWILLGGTMSLDTSVSEFGSTSVALTASSTIQLEQFVDVSDQNFYTFSAYFQAATSGGTGIARLIFVDEDGVEVDASGTSSSGDCSWDSANLWYQIVPSPSASEFERYDCLFTVPEGTQQVRVLIGSPSSSSASVYVDAVQLELGEDANIFAEGYSGTPTEVYYQIAPNYLGCTGSDTDPEECDSYAQVCSAQEVGCSLYTPEDGDPNVPAIISELDECPSECVGYTTYKQEATDFESESFPLYFIADSASACSSQYVGCDSYTNLGTVEAGGEGIEYYTDLRFCLSTDIANSSAENTTPATFFTWEGSDNAGYQLQTWYLLESNYEDSANMFIESGYVESSPELAPCTHISMTNENIVVCDEDAESDLADDVWGNADCDEHDDIFENPDCREFFDTEGNIHYRQYSDTISISDECSAYRKDADNETDCDASGGWWTDQGFCRYYVLPEESTECPAEQNGCREYTGGTGRNATTILNETFESGTYEDFVMADIANYPDEISISNESVATEGHSLYVLAPSSGMAGIETTQIYLDATKTTETYDEDDSTTCTGNGGTVSDAGCDVTDDIDGDGSDDEDCSVLDGQESCGSLTGELVAGKTFVLDFWAKGNGNLYVTFVEEGGIGDVHDFVDQDETVITPVALDGSWALYSLGPVDTSAYEDFDENAVIRFTTDAGKEFHLDNVTLKQVEENITIIKDSWVIPSTCDQTPEGVDSDQYYLGCEAYTDHNGSDVDLYQFSDLCSEEVVGCEGFFHTANSDSEYTQVYNARCMYSADTDFTDDDVVTSNTACEVNGVEYCTIGAGESYCLFDADQAFPGELPVETVSSTELYAIVYGPETVVVPGDTPVYIVADDNYACTSSVMGCQELGEPTYAQDQSEVESFESVYYINLPGDYDAILCDHEALFCEEWESTQDGNFYFKDPLDKECEYKTSVTINNRSYFGWFRSGTTEPCYWEDGDGDGAYDPDADEEYMIAGEEFGVWNNGDEDDGDTDYWDFYDGWVASCDSKYDLCTEFVDVVDTGGGLNEDGQSYYFTNDDLLSEEALTSSQRCNGQVSQKFGCALFNNTTVSELSYNAGASYVLSTHADVFYGGEMNSLVDPVSCTTEDGGVFTISDADAAVAGTDTEVDLCARRCSYSLSPGDLLTTHDADQSGLRRWFERGCFVDADCPVLTTYKDEQEIGTCKDLEGLEYTSGYGSAEDYVLEDDTNEVLKVNRDRSCAAWLACDSSRTSWNTSTNKYDTICDSIDLCVEGSQQGDRATCSQWEERDPTILSTYQYSARDVTWTGYENSGQSIPNQLPVEYYTQFNLAPTKACVKTTGESILNDNGYPLSCNQPSDCGTGREQYCTRDSMCAGYGDDCNEEENFCYYNCSEDIEKEYRLVYNAGPCDSTQDSGVGDGGDCAIGFCESSPENACSSNSDCVDEDCVVGYCQAIGDTDCVNSDCSCNPDENESDGTNDDCSGVKAGFALATEKCDPVQFVCVDVLTTDDDRTACVTSFGCDNPSQQECIPTAQSVKGSCFNNRCLTDIIDSDGDRLPDQIDENKAREQSCRRYPEIDSPFPYQVVDQWLEVGTEDGTDTDSLEDLSSSLLTAGTDDLQPWSIPYNYVSGYQDSNVCAPGEDGEVTNDCLCSYDKVEYGDGTQYRYYEFGSVSGNPIMEGICGSGERKNLPCSTDAECISSSVTSGGSCMMSTRVDSLYGWYGYCLEQDSSIQINGSSDSDDQACLSWLPVDQLTGATDLYGKNTEAGFPIEDTYYCAETAYYTDLYPLGVNFDSEGLVENMEPACAIYKDNSYYGSGTKKYDSCYKAAYCPTGWVAVVGYIGTSTSGSDHTHCSTYHTGTPNDYTDRWAFADVWMDRDMQGCPYFCVPENSYHAQGDDIGTSCDEDLIKVDSDIRGEHGGPRTDGNVFGTKYVLAGGFSAWDDSGTDTQTVEGNFWDCVVRGVPTSETTTYDLDWLNNVDGYNKKGYGYKLEDAYRLSWGLTHRAINGTVGRCDYATGEPCNVSSACSSSPSSKLVEACKVHCSTFSYCGTTACSSGSSDCSEIDVGDDTPRNSGSIQGYLGCYEIVQASSSDLEVGNKAWTNRLLFSGYETSDQDGTFTRSGVEFSFTASDEPTPAGALLFSEYYEEAEEDYMVINEWGEKDSWPMPVSSCDSEPDNGGDMGFITIPYGEDFTASCTNGQTAYPDDRQFFSPTTNETFLNYGGYTYSLGYPYEYIYDGADESEDDSSDYGSSDNGSGDSNTFMIAQTSVWNIMSQLYAKIYSKWRYNWDYSTTGHGAYEKVTTDSDGYDFDISAGFESASGIEIDSYGSGSADAFPNESNRAPKIVSLGTCDGTKCFEDTEGAFTVNEFNSGDIEGESEKNVNVSFFTYAAPNQLPLRNIIVDWGDAFAFTAAGPDWPTDSQSGSSADDNYYKNYRGLRTTNGSEYCDDEDEWGKTSDSCSSEYVSFSHSYVCTDSRLGSLVDYSRYCEVDENGDLTNAPCTGGDVTGASGACVFQPRVHAVDNWGWCTGTCNSNSEDDSDACYGDECNFAACPSGGYAGYDCPDIIYGGTSDPWVYFDGYIIVTP